MLRRILRAVGRRALGRSSGSSSSGSRSASTSNVPRSPASPPIEAEPPEIPEEAFVDIEIDGEKLGAWMGDGAPLVLLDIREWHELQSGVAEGALLIRMNDIPSRMADLPAKDARVVIYCAMGARSFGVSGYLRDQGWTDVWSLVGGFSAYMGAGGTAASPDLGQGKNA